MQTYRRMEAYNQLHAAESTLPQLVENSSHFMEAKVSLPHLQAPTTCPHTEPDQSSPCPSFYFPQIHSNIILPSTPGSSKWSLPSDFPIKTLYALLLSFHTYHITHPLHGPWCDHPNNIWWVHATKLPITQSSTLLCYPVPLKPKNLPQPLTLEHPQSMLLNCATSRKVTGAISDGAIEIFHWLNPLASTMALGSTQPLTRNENQKYLLGGKGGRCVGLTTLPRVPTVWKSGTLNLLEFSGYAQARAGTVLEYRQFFLIPNRNWWISERTALSPASISPAVPWSISDDLCPFSFMSILHCLCRSTGYSKVFFSNNSSHFIFMGNSLKQY